MDDFYDMSAFAPSLQTHHLRIRQGQDLEDLEGTDLADPNQANENLAELEGAAGSNADANEILQNGNMSSRQYNAYVFSLGPERTGCFRRGALPVPLAANDTCLPGWNCE